MNSKIGIKIKIWQKSLTLIEIFGINYPDFKNKAYSNESKKAIPNIFDFKTGLTTLRSYVDDSMVQKLY